MTVDEYVSLVGHNIRLLRERAEMSGLKLSKKTGVSQAGISKIERGGSPTLYTLLLIAEGLGCEPGDLFRRHDDDT